MIKEDFDLSYEEFLEQYVRHPIYDFTISFSYKGRVYQFDWVGADKNEDGSTAYAFVAYENGWGSRLKLTRYHSLMEAIENADIDGQNFKTVYESEESDLIDIS